MVRCEEMALRRFCSAVSPSSPWPARLIDAKKKRLLGATWETYANGSSNVPFAAIMAGRARVGLGEIGYLRLVLGLVVFVVLVVGHEWAIGTSPLPQY